MALILTTVESSVGLPGERIYLSTFMTLTLRKISKNSKQTNKQINKKISVVVQ